MNEIRNTLDNMTEKDRKIWINSFWLGVCATYEEKQQIWDEMQNSTSPAVQRVLERIKSDNLLD